MRAAILHGKEDLRVEELEATPLKAGEVRVAIEAALTCGTDLKVFKRGYHARMIRPPAPFGHELAGVISETASDAKSWNVGDRVVAANSAPCGACFFCADGQENLCDDLLFLNGAYAESIVIPARLVAKNLLRLKPETSFRDAALTEPLACVVHGVNETGLKPGQSVCIIGAGPVGLMFAALAKHSRCEVTVAGRGAERLHAAQKIGADRTIDIAAEPGWVAAHQAGASRGFDVVVEAVGKSDTWEAAMRLVRKGGRINFFGGCPTGTQVPLDAGLMHYYNLTLLASFHHTPGSIRRALELIETGVVRGNDFVSGSCPLTDLPQLFLSMAGGNRAIKTLVRVKE